MSADESRTVKVIRPTGTPGGNPECTLVLSALEASLFRLLLDAVKAAPELKDTTMRVAGGWVRDKLLGRESHDIDIALDNMQGKPFAEAVSTYIAAHGGPTSRIGVIAANPDQSKHLETATMNILGLDIDFVNLRTESYCEHSRIPVAEFGSAEEDALRRDFTINSMFFNLNENVVEDFTGHGFQDLTSRLIRTPLEDSRTTYLDDPLRVMRAVRFASRYRFQIEPGSERSLMDPEVMRALCSKVSYERIGTELDGMLRGEHPVTSLEMLFRLGLLDAVFRFPGVTPHFGESSKPTKADTAAAAGAGGDVVGTAGAGAGGAGAGGAGAGGAGAGGAEAGGAEAGGAGAGGAAAGGAKPGLHVSATAPALDPDSHPEGADLVALLDLVWTGHEAEVGLKGATAPLSSLEHWIPSIRRVAAVSTIINVGPLKDSDEKEARRMLLLATILSPWSGKTYAAKKGKMASVVEYTLKDSLRRRTVDSTLVIALHRAADLMHEAVAVVVEGLPDSRVSEHDAPGLAASCSLPGAARIALGKAVAQAKDLWPQATILAAATADPALMGRFSTVAAMNEFITALIHTAAVDRAHAFEPLLKGTELMSMGILGPSIGVLTEKQLSWMYEDPGISVDAMRELVLKAAADLPPPPSKKSKSRKTK